jgi:hypothetical protein
VEDRALQGRLTSCSWEIDVISILKHGVTGAELLARRLAAARTRVDAASLQGLGLDPERSTFETGAEIREAEGGPKSAQLLTEGVAGEVRCLGDGRRQILALRFPGDVLLPGDGETLVALTRVRTADGARLLACLSDPSPAYQPLRRGWVAANRMDQAILRDQVVRLGRMSAFERVAHMMLEIHERLGQVGLVCGTTFHLPLTQEMVSDVAGLSVVHLNRPLQSLRREDLIGFRHGYVTLRDRARLAEVASYVSAYPAAWRVPDRPAKPAPAPYLVLAS